MSESTSPEDAVRSSGIAPDQDERANTEPVEQEQEQERADRTWASGAPDRPPFPEGQGSARPEPRPSAQAGSMPTGVGRAAASPHGSVTGPAVGVGQVRRTRKATLVVSRIDPWSMLKSSFVYSCALVVVLVVAVVALYALLSGMGVFTSVDNVLAKTAPGKHIGFPLSDVVLVSVVIGVVDVVLITALCTLGAFVYNLVSDLVGGVEVTLSERD